MSDPHSGTDANTSRSPRPAVSKNTHPRANDDPRSPESILRHFGELVEAVLASPSPRYIGSNPEWKRLCIWCNRHRAVLAGHLRNPQAGTPADPRITDWLRELASPPREAWDALRHEIMPFIRLSGLPPRAMTEPLFRNPRANRHPAGEKSQRPPHWPRPGSAA